MFDALGFGALTLAFGAIGWRILPEAGLAILIPAAAGAHLTLGAIYTLAARARGGTAAG